MLKNVNQLRIVRLVKFLFSKEKIPCKTQTAFPIEYSFRVIEQEDRSIRVLIKKNDVPYCQYDSADAKFYDPSHIDPKNIPVDEKCFLWKHINQFDKGIDGLTFLSEAF